MHREPLLLSAVPQAPVRGLAELYAIAFTIAQQATERYRPLATRMDERFRPVAHVFHELTTRERDRCSRLSDACIAACGKRPDKSDLRWAPNDLVPAAEIADISDSSLSTPYSAWALGTRHRQRAFVFWTYVIALAEDPIVRLTAEKLAREALADGNQLRRERRLAWRAERQAAPDHAATTDGGIAEPASAALLESLLLRDMMAWSQRLDPILRERLMTLDPSPLPPPFPAPTDWDGADPEYAEIEQVKRRALRRAEQLSNIYLDDADRAVDQSSMEFAQKLAAQSIMRLAGLRHLASETGLR